MQWRRLAPFDYGFSVTHDGESDILFLQFCTSFRTTAERGDHAMMDVIDLVCQLIGVVCRVLSATFSIKTYYKNKKK